MTIEQAIESLAENDKNLIKLIRGLDERISKLEALKTSEDNP